MGQQHLNELARQQFIALEGASRYLRSPSCSEHGERATPRWIRAKAIDILQHGSSSIGREIDSTAAGYHQHPLHGAEAV